MNRVNDYIFHGRWVLLSESYPPSGTRVILTDGNSVVIGSVVIEENKITWLFDKNDLEGYNPIMWMETPQIINIENDELII